MNQSHHTHVPGLFWTKSYVHSRGPHGPRAAPSEFCLPVRGPKSFDACIISLRAPYGFRYCKQPVNSTCGARTGPVRPNTTPVREFCQFWFCQFPYMSVRLPYGTLAGPAAPYGSRRIRKNIEDFRAGPVRCPYGDRTGYSWSPENYSTKP